MSVRHITPTLRIGQRTSITREIQLREGGHSSDPLDLSGAESVTLTLEHYEFAFTAVDGGACTIVNPQEGIVSYTFDQSDTSLHGRYSLQFEVTWADGSTQLVPPSSDEWVMDVGRRQPSHQPLEAPSITADEGVFGSLQTDTFDAQRASIGEIVGDPVMGSISMDTLDVDALVGGIVGARGPLTRIDGSDLQINANGELEWVDPGTGGFVDGSDHDHSATGSGGDMLRPLSVTADKIQTSRAETAETDSTTLNVIKLESDTYTVSSTIDIASNTIVDGQGATIQIADAADFFGGVFTVDGAENVTIKNVTLDLNAAGTTPTSHSHNLGVSVPSNTSGATNVTVENVTIKNGAYRAAAFYHTSDLTVTDCRLENCGEVLLEVDHGCRDVDVIDNRLVGGGTENAGIRVDATAEGVEAVSIRGNIIRGVSTGVTIQNVARTACVVENNTILNCTAGVIEYGHHTVRDNTIHGCRGGVETHGAGTITGNQIVRPYGVALRAHAGAEAPTITDNTVIGGNARGVWLETDDCTVENNTFRRVDQWAILADTNNNTIVGNTVTVGNGATTLAADAAAGATEIDVNSHVFLPGEHISIGTETVFIDKIVESASNGAANTLRLTSALANAHALGTAVESTSENSQGIRVTGNENVLRDNETPHLSIAGSRTMVNGRSSTASPPTDTASSWSGKQALAEEHDVTVVSDLDKQYKAVNGKWQRINSWFEIDKSTPATPLNYSVSGLGSYDEIKIEMKFYIDRASADTGNFLMRVNDDAGSKYVGRMLSTTGFDSATATEFTIAEGSGYRSLSAEIIISNQPRASVHADVSHSTNRVLNDGWVNDFAIQANSVQIWESEVTSPGGALQNPIITVKGRNL